MADEHIDIAWRPSETLRRESRMQAFFDRVGVADRAGLNERADADPAWFWDEVINFLDVRFYEPYDSVLDTSKGAAWPVWCAGGKTNVVLNCIDRHRETPVWDKVWIVWSPY